MPPSRRAAGAEGLQRARREGRQREQEEARHASKVTRVMRCDNALRLIMRCVAAALVELREQEVICSPYTVARLRALTPKLLHCATASIKTMRRPRLDHESLPRRVDLQAS